MISSTALDLPEHRKEAIDACLRLSVFPIAMEQLPARDADAIKVSSEMVAKADIYIGIYAWRYGHVPEGHDISITEMEFNRAVERGIPVLIFTIHNDHPLTFKMFEADKNAQEKLQKLKDRAIAPRGRLEFKSPVELRSHIIQSLSELLREQKSASEEKRAPSSPPPNLIPAAPAPYIAHPYLLLQSREVVGRRKELNLLTEWITTNKKVLSDVRLFNIVAIGGMGKSALAWKWFNDIAPNKMAHLAGRMWWSFYESDAYFENLIIRALAYTAGMSVTEVREMSAHDREDQLLQLLDQKPFLLVLDGLERILLPYSRAEAARPTDDDLEEKTANKIARSLILTDEVKEAYVEKHHLRRCADPRAGRFLRLLTQVHKSRVLISTRLYPAELQTNTSKHLYGCYPIFIKGLTDDDALSLWREFIGGDRSGTSEQLLPLFNAFDNYPLLLRALAGEIAEYRPAPGDFDRWRRDHPDFNPCALPLKNVKTHVLEFALRGLDEVQSRVLQIIAAFRMPATWGTLRDVLTGEGKACPDDRALDLTLTALEDRALVGWDRPANRYDLHPIVRGVVWNGLTDDTRRGVYTNLHAHFKAVPEINKDAVKSLGDLTPAIELYNALIGLGRYRDACDLFYARLSEVMHFRLSCSRQRVELLEMLFPDGLDRSPRLRDPGDQVFTLDELATSYLLDGQPGRAGLFYRRANTIRSVTDDEGINISLHNLSLVSRLSGALLEAEVAVRRALVITRTRRFRSWEAVNLRYLGLTLAARGLSREAASALQRSLRISVARHRNQSEGVTNSYFAQSVLWLGAFADARSFANRAWELAQVLNQEADFIRAARVLGAAALGLQEHDIADERLNHALTRARQVNLKDEELPALIALAELRRQQGKASKARESLDHVWASAEDGPYPLFHADACNVLAQIEHDAGNLQKAIDAASHAYRLAWCDGPPFAYHWGLVAAQKHLRELGAPEPEMTPFDESKFEPMPEVEIDPDD
jgi:tetratricopeptide (TPR) repeat protein